MLMKFKLLECKKQALAIIPFLAMNEWKQIKSWSIGDYFFDLNGFTHELIGFQKIIFYL
jgi:hypothetical protein